MRSLDVVHPRLVRLVERRSFFRAIKESLSSESDGTPGGEPPPLS